MRLPLVTLALSLLLSLPGVARADDYPTAIIDRPLALPPSTYQAYGAFAWLHDSNVPSGTPSSVDLMQLGLDIGIAKKFQVGAYTNIRLSQSSELEAAVGSAQYQLLAFAAVRGDVGIQRVDSGDVYGEFGVGLPLRLKLTDMFAVISSRPYAYGYEDDIFQFRVGSNSTISEFRVPVGLLVQLSKNWSTAVRSGYRRQGGATFVPFGADLTGAFGPLDFGATVDLYGQVGPDNGNGYADLLLVRGWVQLRI